MNESSKRGFFILVFLFHSSIILLVFVRRILTQFLLIAFAVVGVGVCVFACVCVCVGFGVGVSVGVGVVGVVIVVVVVVGVGVDDDVVIVDLKFFHADICYVALLSFFV